MSNVLCLVSILQYLWPGYHLRNMRQNLPLFRNWLGFFLFPSGVPFLKETRSTLWKTPEIKTITVSEISHTRYVLIKGTTRVNFSNSHNLWKPYDNNVYIGYRQPKPHIHTNDMILARERTATIEAACTMECLPACQKSSFQIRHHLRWWRKDLSNLVWFQQKFYQV